MDRLVIRRRASDTRTIRYYHPSIRAVRITLAGTFATATAFQLRYRVRVK